MGKHSKMASSGTARALRQEASASSLPVSASSLIGILEAGKPVSETNTTTFSNGSTQTGDITIVPDTSNSTVTITRDITLADGDREKVLDVAAISGNIVTQSVTTTLPSRADPEQGRDRRHQRGQNDRQGNRFHAR